MRGDLLLARAGPLQTFGNVVKTVPQDRIDGLREEALARLRALRERPREERLPRYVLQLNRRAEARAGRRLARARASTYSRTTAASRSSSPTTT